jgi:adenylate cyclase
MDGKKQIAAAVKDYIARERISREQFAFKTRLGKSTLDKFLIGLFSDRTLAIVEEHTKLALRPMLAGASLKPPKRRKAGGRSPGPSPIARRSRCWRSRT